MREYLYSIQYIKGKHNLVADGLSRPILVVNPPPETTRLGKGKVEMRRLQMEEERWREMIEYLEGGKVARQQYPRATLDQFVMWDEVLHYLTSKKDSSVHFWLVVPQSLKKIALEHAHVNLGHLGQRKTLTRAESFFSWPNIKADVCMYVC